MQPFLLGGLRRLLVVHGDGGQGLFVEWPICKKVLPESLLAEVKVVAQEVFQCNFLRLNPEKHDLVMNKSLKELGVEDGEILMATLQWPQIAATQRDFALFFVIMVASSLGAPRTARFPWAWLTCNS